MVSATQDPWTLACLWEASASRKTEPTGGMQTGNQKQFSSKERKDLLCVTSIFCGLILVCLLDYRYLCSAGFWKRVLCLRKSLTAKKSMLDSGNVVLLTEVNKLFALIERTMPQRPLLLRKLPANISWVLKNPMFFHLAFSTTIRGRCTTIFAVLFIFLSFLFFSPFIIFFLLVVDFVIQWNETAMGLHVLPILIPPPFFLFLKKKKFGV